MLTGRDLNLLCDLHSFGLLSRSQLRELGFGSVQRTNARLRSLFDHGLVERHFPTVWPEGDGTEGAGAVCGVECVY